MQNNKTMKNNQTDQLTSFQKKMYSYPTPATEAGIHKIN